MSRLHRGCIQSGLGPRTEARRLGHYGARQHAYTQQLAAAGNDLTYVHNPDLTHGFIQFTRWPHACHTATIELAELIKKRIG
jgi:hypothetical protein